MLKKLLLIQIPKFYGYERSLVEAASYKYEKVVLIPDNCFSILTRAVLMKIGLLKLIDGFCSQLLKRKLEKVRIEFACIDCLIVLGRDINPVLLSFIESTQVNVRFFLWDSISNINPSSVLMEKITQSDRVFSFDGVDCGRYNFQHLAVFRSESVRSEIRRVFDFVYFASFNEARFKAVECFVKSHDAQFLSIIFFSTQSWSVFMKNWWRILKFSLISLRRGIVVIYLPFPLGKNIYYFFLSRSRRTLECRSDRQSASTQRFSDSIAFSLDCIDLSDLLSRGFYTAYGSEYLQQIYAPAMSCNDWLDVVFAKKTSDKIS